MTDKTPKEDPKSFWGMIYRLMTEGDAGEVWGNALKMAGVYAMILAPMFVMIGGFSLIQYLSKPANYMPAPKCLDVKQINGTTYIIDQCKGTVQIVSKPTPPKKPPPQPVKTSTPPAKPEAKPAGPKAAAAK
jgi:hypothetical protein